MSGKHLSDEEIANIVNNKSLDQIVKDNERYSQSIEVDSRTRTPLYIIVTAAFLIATVNSAFFKSNVILGMCLIFGGGAFIYLWSTRNKS